MTAAALASCGSHSSSITYYSGMEYRVELLHAIYPLVSDPPLSRFERVVPCPAMKSYSLSSSIIPFHGFNINMGKFYGDAVEKGSG